MQEKKQTEKAYSNGLMVTNQVFMGAVQKEYTAHNLKMDEYSKLCVINGLSAIYELLSKEGISINDIDQSNLTGMLTNLAALKLNAAASPNEVYFIIRNQSRKKKNEKGVLVESKIKVVEMGIEGDGNDALLARFGRDIKKVYPFWAVRANDDFKYPSYRGIEVTPPEWTPTGAGKVVRVIYPVQLTNDKVHYYIGEREDVKANLIAHMMNNLMWDKNKATKKQQIKDKTAEMTLDQILADDELIKLGQISPAWREPQSQETMILRKMRNNVVKKIPKDFSTGLAAVSYQETSDPDLARARRDISNEANTEDFDDTTPKQVDSKTSKIKQLPQKATTRPVPKAEKKEEVPVKAKEEAPTEPQHDESPEDLLAGIGDDPY